MESRQPLLAINRDYSHNPPFGDSEGSMSVIARLQQLKAAALRRRTAAGVELSLFICLALLHRRLRLDRPGKQKTPAIGR